MAKTKMPKLVSPVCTAAFAWVNKPDDKFNKDKPEYKLTLVMDEGPEADAFIEKIKELGSAFARDAGIKLKKTFQLPVRYFDDDEKEEFEGKVRINAKSQFAPGQVDASCKVLPEGIFVMSGDKVRASMLVGAYEGMGSGVNLKLRNVQLIEKATSIGTPSDDFDAVDGYTADVDATVEDGEDF